MSEDLEELVVARAVASEIDAIDDELSNVVNEESRDEFRERASRQIARAAIAALRAHQEGR